MGLSLGPAEGLCPASQAICAWMSRELGFCSCCQSSSCSAKGSFSCNAELFGVGSCPAHIAGSGPGREPHISSFAFGLSSLGLQAVKEKCQLLVILGFPRLVLCPQTAMPSTSGFQCPVTFRGRETRRDIPQASRRCAGACGRTGTRLARGAGQAAGTAVWIVPAGPVSS